MSGKFFCAAVALMACVGLTTGCAAPERISGLKPALLDKAAGGSSASVKVSASCRFSINSISDRREQTHLGSLGRTQVDGADFKSWLSSGIAAMPEYSSEAAAPITMSFEILKAYIHGLGTLKSTHLVVRVKAVGDKIAAPLDKVYRGTDSSMNWANSESEIQEAFERAAAHLRQQIASDISGLCGRTPTPV